MAVVLLCGSLSLDEQLCMCALDLACAFGMGCVTVLASLYVWCMIVNISSGKADKYLVQHGI